MDDVDRAMLNDEDEDGDEDEGIEVERGENYEPIFLSKSLC